ncbi:MAG: mycothiol synthase [Actinobacteria bacterium]|nr:mycothiol synthase [Actinomycetota bacterium]
MSTTMTPSDSRPLRPEALEGLIARATAADGSPPFSDGALIDPARTLTWLGPAAALSNGTEAEFVVDPDARAHGHGTRMLEHLLAQGDTLFWAHGDHPAARALAARHGLVAARTLLHLEAAIPEALEGESFEGPTSAAGISRASMTGLAARDADAWLDLNARAFAHHPEQGGVTRADLDALTAEPWFDADDFLLLWDGAELIGYSWMKVEGCEGEFYVVGVSPERQGEGLGRRLVEAGLARLASRGIRTAHLYVEGDNAPALALYRSFGFTDRSVDIQYKAG